MKEKTTHIDKNFEVCASEIANGLNFYDVKKKPFEIFVFLRMLML